MNFRSLATWLSVRWFMTGWTPGPPTLDRKTKRLKKLVDEAEQQAREARIALQKGCQHPQDTCVVNEFTDMDTLGNFRGPTTYTVRCTICLQDIHQYVRK